MSYTRVRLWRQHIQVQRPLILLILIIIFVNCILYDYHSYVGIHISYYKIDFQL